MHNPYRHHPTLRGKIVEPEKSSWRSLTTQSVIAQLAKIGVHADWFYPDDIREELRRAAMLGHEGGDLWVFAYGSLMWDPGFRFVDVRRAHVAGHARRFILRDDKGGRGTAEAPGVMAALDTGGAGCDGLAFRIAAEEIPRETQILFQREMIAPGYIPSFVTARLDDSTVRALTFVADHSTDLIDGSISRADQIRFAATGVGYLGTSYEYLSRLASQFQALGIEDAEITALLTDVEAQMA